MDGSEGIIVLDLLPLNLIPQMSHPSNVTNLAEIRFIGSAIVTLTIEDGTTAIKVESSASPIS